MMMYVLVFNLTVQMGIASTRSDVKNENGSFEIKFDKGPARKVPSRLASLVLQKFNKLKPADKLKFQKQAEKSYADFLRAVKDMTK